MQLCEKIYYCRKKAGLSQDALAEAVGVSRQAISKWELGAAVPETTKLVPLAAALGVSVDWLLSEDAPEDETPGGSREYDPGEGGPPTPEDAAETLPGLVRRLVRRWGWLAGVYLIRCGAIVFFGATMVNLITLPSFKRSQQLIEEYPVLRDVYGMTGTEGNVLTIVATIVAVYGLVIVIAGIALTVYLRKRRMNWKSYKERM